MRLFDLHCDTVYECYTRGLSLVENQLQLDLQRGQRYVPWCQCFAVWMPDTLHGEEAFTRCCDILRFAHAQAQQHPDLLTLAQNRNDWLSAVRSGHCAGLLSVENATALAGCVESLKTLVHLGVKMITLTWNGSNELGHGCTSGCHDGLTPFGRKAVSEMIRQGIVPDVSHLNEAGFWDVVTMDDRPVVASHSLSRAIHDHPRNLTDSQFTAIAERGGLVGLNLCESHLGGHSLDDIFRHLEHYLSLGGEKTVAMGTDFDGTELPPDWDGIAFIETLVEDWLRRGLPETLTDAILFGNAFQFWSTTLQQATDGVK